jgi:hypothetical protein
MEKLKTWLRRRGFGLDTSPRLVDCVCFNALRVYIDSRQSYQSKLSTLLHECGHVDILFSRVKSKHKRFGGATLKEWLKYNAVGERPTKSSKLCDLAEEMEAWERGEILARRLKLRVKMKTFRSIKTRALLTYVRDAAKRSPR